VVARCRIRLTKLLNDLETNMTKTALATEIHGRVVNKSS